MSRIVPQLAALILLLVFPTTLLAEEVLYYHTDNFGTPMAITDKTGKVVWQADELPFGEEYQTQEIPERNDRRFLGKQLDKETGLVYMGARYLDPRTGRFTQPDPVGLVDPATGKVNQQMLLNPQRLNRYVYGLNNPYRYVDPDGMNAKHRPGMEYQDILEGGGIRLGGGPSGSFLKSKGSKIATKTRAANIKKGIPETELGPSGKPKIHVKKHPSLKRAKDAAKNRAGKGGTTNKHPTPQKSKGHFHGQKQGGAKIRVHDEYPD